MEVSGRLSRWIEQQFPTARGARVLAVLRDLPEDVLGGQDPERVQASLVITTDGDWDAFLRRVELARWDWRDALVGAGLGNADWPARLDEVLGPRP